MKVEDSSGSVDSASITTNLATGTVTGLLAGYKVEFDATGKFDQVKIKDVSGKFDVGGFGATVAQPTPGQKLDFTVKATDGDGDNVSDSFSIGIDGTGVYDDGVVAGVVGTV